MKLIKSKNGITLIALVITIVVITILAGISLNAAIGDDGIITKAQQASKESEIADDIEVIKSDLTRINIENETKNQQLDMQQVSNRLLDKGTVENVLKTQTGLVVVGRDSNNNRYFLAERGKNTYRILKNTDGILKVQYEEVGSSGGGDITGGYTIVRQEDFYNSSTNPADKGRYTISANAEVAFVDSISGELSIYVKSGVHATIGIYDNLTLSNQSLTSQNIYRSAIDIEPGATLDLYLAEGVTVKVDSAYGSKGATWNNRTLNPEGNKGGDGGRAGIHVPEGATLSLYGDGTIIAFGGNATAGGAGTDDLGDEGSLYNLNMETTTIKPSETNDNFALSHKGNGGGRWWWRRCRNWRKRWKRWRI